MLTKAACIIKNTGEQFKRNVFNLTNCIYFGIIMYYYLLLLHYLIYFKITFLPVIANLHYSSIQCHMILQKSL